jgi:hypothetical protein
LKRKGGFHEECWTKFVTFEPEMAYSDFPSSQNATEVLKHNSCSAKTLKIGKISTKVLEMIVLQLLIA